MNTRTPQDGDADPRTRLDDARAVYALLRTALKASVERIASGEDTKIEAAQRGDLFRSHVKQLQQVFEIEGSLGKLGKDNFVTRLDLDAARVEIRERLARIRERRRDREISERPE